MFTIFCYMIRVLHLPAGVRSDIAWWHIFSLHWNGVRLLTPALPMVSVFTDASGRKGLGGICGSPGFPLGVPAGTSLVTFNSKSSMRFCRLLFAGVISGKGCTLL